MRTKLNNKGFTLVELLATVVILLAISTVAVASISASIDRQNEKKDKATEDLIISYGRLYIEERPGLTCVNVDELIKVYGLDVNAFKNSAGKTITGSVVYTEPTNVYQHFGAKCS